MFTSKILIAQIRKPHGLTGAFKVSPYTNPPESFKLYRNFFLNERSYSAEYIKPLPLRKLFILKLQNIDSAEEALRFNEAGLYVSRQDITLIKNKQPNLAKPLILINDILNFKVFASAEQLEDVLKISSNVYVLSLIRLLLLLHSQRNLEAALSALGMPSNKKNLDILQETQNSYLSLPCFQEKTTLIPFGEIIAYYSAGSDGLVEVELFQFPLAEQLAMQDLQKSKSNKNMQPAFHKEAKFFVPCHREYLADIQTKKSFVRLDNLQKILL